MRTDQVPPRDPQLAEAHTAFWRSLVSWNPDDKHITQRVWGTPTDRRALRQARIDALAAKVGTPEARRAYERRHREFRALLRKIRG